MQQCRFHNVTKGEDNHSSFTISKMTQSCGRRRLWMCAEDEIIFHKNSEENFRCRTLDRSRAAAVPIEERVSMIRAGKSHHVWMVSSMLAIAVTLWACLYALMAAMQDTGAATWFQYHSSSTSSACPKPVLNFLHLAPLQSNNNRSSDDHKTLQEALNPDLQRHHDQEASEAAWRISSDSSSSSSTSDACAGRYIYMYDLPPFFNQKLVDDCRNADPPWVYILCEDLENKGLGEQIVLDSNDEESSSAAESLAEILRPLDAWYKTHQFILELMYHERLRRYECLTKDPAKAVFSYIPFYSALDLTQKLFDDVPLSKKDRACQRLMGWLQGNAHWVRSGGRDHVLLLGRIVWDYTRREFENGWGNPLLSFPEMENVTKVSIERGFFLEDQRAVPYPTSFHPSSDAQIVAWQKRIRDSRRDFLVVFVGAPRSDKLLAGSIRSALMRQCKNSSSSSFSQEKKQQEEEEQEEQQQLCSLISCSVVDCERKPQLLTRAFLNAVFCLQPPGDSATRRGVFDCLVAGSIPVFFDPNTAYTQYQWHLPSPQKNNNNNKTDSNNTDSNSNNSNSSNTSSSSSGSSSIGSSYSSSYSVFFPAEAVVNGSINVIQELQRIPSSTIASMQRTINALVPSLLYVKPGSNLTTKDAFDIALDNLFHHFRST